MSDTELKFPGVYTGDFNELASFLREAAEECEIEQVLHLAVRFGAVSKALYNKLNRQEKPESRTGGSRLAPSYQTLDAESQIIEEVTKLLIQHCNCKTAAPEKNMTERLR